MQLLYVDDDRINLMLFEHACSSIEGLQLFSASSGAEAVELARANRIELMVIDLHLPDTNGHALLQTLRTDASLAEVPALLCTADDGAEVREAALAAGFSGCWGKPMDAHALRRELAVFNPALAG
jgi:CheY-like chemotaxis protein